MFMESKVIYFDEVGPGNTDKVFDIVKEKLKSSGVKKIVLASTTGATARKAMEFFRDDGIKLVVVPHQYDFMRETNPFPEDLVKEIRDSGHDVHFGTMLFHTEKLFETNVSTLMANLLRCFSQGVKVCFEIIMMATDAGLCKTGEKVIVVAGSGRGSDTALVMQAASSRSLKKLRVNEMLCKPLNPLNIEEALAKDRPRD
jgi:hypothetical protein